MSDSSDVEHLHLDWQGPLAVHSIPSQGVWWQLLNEHVPEAPGVYAFTEYDTPIEMNEKNRDLRNVDTLLYVGKASNLRKRLRYYFFRPYETIVRRDRLPRHVADEHKGKAMLHAAQFFLKERLGSKIFVWWALTKEPKEVESVLIKALHPVLNTSESDRSYFM